MNQSGSRSAHSEGDRYDGAPKSQLHCPGCGHESPTDGDWNDVQRDGAHDGRLLVRCPDCGTTITERPGRSPFIPESPPPAD